MWARGAVLSHWGHWWHPGENGLCVPGWVCTSHMILPRIPRARLRGWCFLAHGPTEVAMAWLSPSCASQQETSRGEAALLSMGDRGGGTCSLPGTWRRARPLPWEGCHSCRALSAPTAASVYPVHLLQVLLPYPWSLTGYVLQASPGRTQRFWGCNK